MFSLNATTHVSKISEILTRDNITFLIAVLSFFMSSLSILIQFVNSRRKINFDILDHVYVPIHQVNQVFCLLQNNSSAAITITSISIHFEKNYYCELFPKLIRKTPSATLKTPSFPIHLSAHEGIYCFLEFVYCGENQLAPGKKVDFQIYTNRGAVKKSVTLCETQYYLHMR